jgi:hypothetical protein
MTRSAPIVRGAVLLSLALGLTGCGEGVSNTLGLTRPPPNEFLVTTRAPLQIPDGDRLPTPRPGEPRPQETPERRQAEEALVPQLALQGPGADSTDTSVSPGQQALIAASGPPAPPNIRQQIAADKPDAGPKQAFTDRLMFWKDKPTPGTVVDPTREAQRLRANAALGQSVETGDTPIVQPKRPSLLESLF